MAKLFISYRREDSQHQADRLHSALKPYLANPRSDVFIDVDNIPFGVDFIEYLDSKVAECEALLALIGPGWLQAANPQTGLRRLDDPKDFVRIEIASALQRGIPVVPVLLDGAPVPNAGELPEDLQALATRNGVPVQRLTFDADVARLVGGLPIELKPSRRKAADSTGKGGGAGLAIGALAALLLIGGIGAFAWLDPMGVLTPGPQQTAEATGPSSTIGTELAEGDGASLSSDAVEEVEDPATRNEAIRDLQRALSGLGLYTSAIDGDAGPGTNRAVSAFASEYGGTAPDLSASDIAEIEALTARVTGEAEAYAEREAEAWSEARGANSIAAYQAYLADYTNGANAATARSRIAALSPTPEPQYRAGQTFRDALSGGGQGPQMVVVPAGSFTMGSPSGESGREDGEGPQHTVRIGSAFAVGKYEVTWAEWEACVEDGGCNGYTPNDQGWGKGARPVINVTWEDAKAYITWLNLSVSGVRDEPYRLLTEAEWEYAARAGTQSAYWWGSTASHEYANYGTDRCCRGLASGRDRWMNTAPSGSFSANAFGLHDMHGNVWEWTEDCYQDSYTGAPTDGSARQVSNCSRRVVRGGSWGYTPQSLRSANRNWGDPSGRVNFIGFRVARTL